MSDAQEHPGVAVAQEEEGSVGALGGGGAGTRGDELAAGDFEGGAHLGDAGESGGAGEDRDGAGLRVEDAHAGARGVAGGAAEIEHQAAVGQREEGLEIPRRGLRFVGGAGIGGHVGVA